MPRYIAINLNEMATVGWYGEQPSSRDYKIFIIEEKHPNPHFHLQYKEKGDKDYYVITVRIKDFEVMKFKRGIPHRLSKSVFKQLIDFLKAPRKKNKIFQEEVSNWDYLINLWDTANEEDPVKEIADLDEMKTRGDFLYNAFVGVK